ncbi:MAG: hypothetical protein AAGP08_19165, partial [Pseudomonadota bacterium]
DMTPEMPWLRRLFRDEPVFAGATLLFLLMIVPTLGAMALDTRLHETENIWVKPLKFQVALAIYLGTLTFYARWLPWPMRDAPWYRVYTWVVIAACMAEIVWIGGAASLGTISHFNVATPALEALYGVMGLLATVLTTASLVYGIAIWRNEALAMPEGVRIGLGVGLVITFPLTLLTAGYMSMGLSHFVGVPITNSVLPLMGWSTEVGDLRVAHFFATHAMHAVPLAAWLLGASARVVYVFGALYAGFVLATFAQAIAGLPLIPL